MPWFSARSIFRHSTLQTGSGVTVYEEQVILLESKNEDEALEKAEAASKGYSDSLEGVDFLGLIQVYTLDSESVGPGTEVFSLMRESKLAPESYLSAYFEDGQERSRK